MSYAGLGHFGFGQTAPIVMPTIPTEKRKFGGYEYLAIPEAHQVAVLAMLTPYRVTAHAITEAPELGFTKDMEVLQSSLTAPANAALLLPAIEAARDAGKAVGAKIYADGTSKVIIVDADQLPGIAKAQAAAAEPTPVLYDPKGGWVVAEVPPPGTLPPGTTPPPGGVVMAKTAKDNWLVLAIGGGAVLLGLALVSKGSRETRGRR